MLIQPTYIHFIFSIPKSIFEMPVLLLNEKYNEIKKKQAQWLMD